MARTAAPVRPSWPAWPLPLLAGLLPLVATLLAFALSVRLGFVEGCNPLFEGCVSISRAARHALPNHVFRALVLPAAALQALCWMLCGASLRGLGAAATRKLRALPWVGVTAAVFLVLYGTFLGTEGEAYRWMRRYGVVAYFGGTTIAMLIVADATIGLAALDRRLARFLFALCCALPVLGLVNAFAPLMGVDDGSRVAVQNAAEWWAGLVFTLFYAALAWVWRAARIELTLG